MRARVTLRGLLVEREPGRVEVVAWSTVEGRGSGMYVEVGPDGEQIGGWRDVLRLKDTREGRVAARLHERAMRQAFRDGTLEIVRSFRSEIKDQRFSSIIMGSLLLALVWLMIFQMNGPWYWRLGYLCFTLLPIVAVWWTMIRPLPFYGSRGTLRVLLSRDVICIERRDGSCDDHTFQDARRVSLSGVPLIEFCDGTILRVPGRGGIRTVLKMIQQERFPEDQHAETGALRSSLIRSCVYFMLGGVVAGVLTWYLQGQGLMPASRWRPLLGGLGFGLGMPCILMLSFVFQKWMDSGVPPWKKKAWTEMFR